ncbi:MAG: tRNA (guanosine(37)-N1)-methyltransferase TrmD [Ureaplasma sp.]|nr:tRNA (guanosine(37)-N1)-methyltransferase TrmD [Ureaplasma sp.]
MFKITVLTLFENSINWIKEYSIVKNAIEKKELEIEVINFRNYSNDKHQKVDHPPYGGGGGMLISIQPIYDCLQKIKTNGSLVYLLSPIGEIYNQNYSIKLIENTNHLILICGHYEGIDYRILEYVDGIISIGDYILSGGENAANVVIDSIARQLNNVINKNSLINESFNNNLLDYPSYTRPEKFDNKVVPSILLSGNHKLINEWRINQREIFTKKYRPDLYKKYLKERGK